MSEISSILEKLRGTREAEILTFMEEAYGKITSEQGKWYEESKFFCPSGCGECCRNFEPDLLEAEALFMAAWLIDNQPEVAQQLAQGVFPFPREKGCQLWDEFNPYHCTIYGGRASICRLFGASAFLSKNRELVWKPCKFYPAEELAKHNSVLSHRQYSKAEVNQIFGTEPPVMSNLMEEVVASNPDNKDTHLIRHILPDTVRKLLWISSLNAE